MTKKTTKKAAKKNGTKAEIDLKLSNKLSNVDVTRPKVEEPTTPMQVDNSEHVEKWECLKRLYNNKDFYTLIMKGYLQDEVVDLTKQLSRLNNKVSEEFTNILRALEGTNRLRNYFIMIEQFATAISEPEYKQPKFVTENTDDKEKSIMLSRLLDNKDFQQVCIVGYLEMKPVILSTHLVKFDGTINEHYNDIVRELEAVSRFGHYLSRIDMTNSGDFEI